MNASAMKWLILVLSVLGLADSWYLADSALTGTPLVCGIDSIDGCNVVAQSVYSHLFGIPLGVFGVGFYAVLIVVAAFAIARSVAWTRRGLLLLGAVGVVASIVFEAIQVFLIKAICIYCLGSAILCLAIFAIALVLWRKERIPVEPSIPAGTVVS